MGSNTVTYCERCGRYRVAETAEATLAERTKERDEAIARALASERCRREDAADHLVDQMLHIQRWRDAEAALARVREALERFEAASPRHYIGCPCLTCSLSDDLRAALTPAAPEPPKGDPR